MCWQIKNLPVSFCGFISHWKFIWCEKAPISEAPHIIFQIPSKEKKVRSVFF